MSTFLVVGESLVDIVQDSTARRTEVPGGSPANVALGLARLGITADLLTWLADDPRGRTVLDHLAASGVTVLPQSLGAARTPTALARLDAEGSATYEFDLDWQLPATTLPHDLRAVHTGSIAAVAHTDPADALPALLQDARRTATITYDPNLRPSIMGQPGAVQPKVDILVALADVVKVSEEDLDWLHPGADPLEVASGWVRDHRCALVVVTHGGRGSTAVRPGGGRVEVQAPPVAVVDTVGAGDSYMSGLLTALHRHDLLGAGQRAALHAVSEAQVAEIVDFATTAAAITVTRAGANPPHLADITAHDVAVPRT
ncbi:carbohydrate kinase [Promicromonospora sp. NPDC060204]|uniref:carbohydrate kinase family protein n=1 Tax=Promicromonospora sp. NPDC060204 TaxID=3347071 RepID=UPI003647FAA7